MGSRECYLYLLDVSRSMGESRTFGNREITKLQRCISYIESKLSQYILRNLKTLEAGVTLIGSHKTDNPLSEAGKEGYEGIRTYIPLGTTDNEMMVRLKRVNKVSNSQSDYLSAMIAGVTILEDRIGTKKYAKNLVLLTDGESVTNWTDEDIQAMVDKMNTYGVELTVIGVDFDDASMGFKEESKSEAKANNEAQFEVLTDKLEASLMGNLERALKVATGPQVKHTASRASKMTLTLGDTTAFPDESLSINVLFKKATAKAPVERAGKMSTLGLRGRAPRGIIDPSLRKKEPVDHSKYALATSRILSKLEESFMQSQQEAADMLDANDDAMDIDEEDRPDQTYEVRKTFLSYYVREEEDESEKTVAEVNRGLQKAATHARKAQANMPLSQTQGTEEEDAPPLELVDADVKTEKAFLYGGTRVPVGDMDIARFDINLNAGVEVLACMSASQLKREWILNDVGYVYAAVDSSSAQISFSALVMSMIEKDLVLLVRYISDYRTKPLKLGCLLPRIGDGSEGSCQYCVFVQMPFAEDLRKFNFPSLTILRNRKGRELSDHSTLPSDEQNKAMASFVDCMDLDTAAKNENDEPCPWFNIHASYNPALHNVKAAIFHRHSHPAQTELPPPHPECIKYMVTPENVLDRSQTAFKHLKDIMNVKAVPVKASTGRGRRKDIANGDEADQEIDFDAFLGEGEDVPSTAPNKDAPKPSSTNGQKRSYEEHDGSVTENSEDEHVNVKAKTETQSPNKLFIGEETPLADYKRLTEGKSSLITEGIRDFLAVILLIVKEVGGRRWDEAIQCIEFIRSEAIQQEEAEQYNTFLRKLKNMAEDSGGLTKFWNERILTKNLGLVTHDEGVERLPIYKEEAERFFRSV